MRDHHQKVQIFFLESGAEFFLGTPHSLLRCRVIYIFF